MLPVDSLHRWCLLLHALSVSLDLNTRRVARGSSFPLVNAADRSQARSNLGRMEQVSVGAICPQRDQCMVTANSVAASGRWSDITVPRWRLSMDQSDQFVPFDPPRYCKFCHKELLDRVGRRGKARRYCSEECRYEHHLRAKRLERYGSVTQAVFPAAYHGAGVFIRGSKR